MKDKSFTSKAINAILGIGVAIVIFFFFVLVFNTIYPEPQWNDCYANSTYMNKPYPVVYENLSAEEKTAYDAEQARIDACSRKSSDDFEFYRKNTAVKVFIGAVIIGILLILSIIFMRRFGTNIAAGLGAAGIALTVYGFAVGWDATGKIVRLIALFISAMIVLGLAIWLNRNK